MGDSAPQNSDAIRCRAFFALQYWDACKQAETNKNVIKDKVKIPPFKALQLQKQIEFEFSERNIETMVPAPSRSESQHSFKPFSITQAIQTGYQSTLVKSNTASLKRLKSLLVQSRSRSIQQSSLLIESRNDVDGPIESRYLLKSSNRGRLLDLNKSADMDRSSDPKQAKAHASSGENLNQSKASVRSTRAAASFEIKVAAARECVKPQSRRGKCSLAKYFSQVTRPLTIKKTLFSPSVTNIDHPNAEIKLPNRKAKHMSLSIAVPKVDHEEDTNQLDLDLMTIQPAPASVYLKSGDLAGMVDDCLLSTFNKVRKSKDTEHTESEIAKKNDNINRRYFAIQRSVAQERAAFRFVRKAFKTKHTDMRGSKDLSDLDKQSLVVLQDTDTFVQHRMRKEASTLKAKVASESHDIGLIGLLNLQEDKPETPLKKLQRLIFEHRMVDRDHSGT